MMSAGSPLDEEFSKLIKTFVDGLQKIEEDPRLRKFAEYMKIKQEFGFLCKVLDEEMADVLPAGQEEHLVDYAQPLYDAQPDLQAVVTKMCALPCKTAEDRKASCRELTDDEMATLRLQAIRINCIAMADFAERIIAMRPSKSATPFN